MKYLILLLLCAPVAAQQCPVLVYNGAPFNTVTSSAGNAQPIASPVTGTIELPTPLGTNLINAQVVPTAWDFSGEYRGLNSVDDFMAWNAPTFIFSTDSSGNITAWSMALLWNTSFGHPVWSGSVTSTLEGDVVNIAYFTVAPTPTDPEHQSISGASAAAGTWSCKAADPMASEVTTLITERNDLYASYVYWAERARALTIELNAALARK